jgi:hypothetical protein
MLCMSCRAEMRVVQIEQDHSMKAIGYERQTLECSGCEKTTRRLAFSGDKVSWPVEYRLISAIIADAVRTPVKQAVFKSGR